MISPLAGGSTERNERCEERDSNIVVDLTETIQEETVNQSSIDQTLCVSPRQPEPESHFP